MLHRQRRSLHVLRLKLNTEKTQFTCCGTRYQLAKVDATCFMVNGLAVTLLPTFVCLGVIVDQEMLFADHVRRLASLRFYWLRQVRSIRRTLTTETTTILVYALVISRADYCNGVLAAAYDVHLRQLQAVLNAASKVDRP